MNAFLPLGLLWVERQVRIKQEEVLDVDKNDGFQVWNPLEQPGAAKGMRRVPLWTLCEGKKKAQKSDPSQRHFGQTTANRHWLGHTAATHSQKVAVPCWALVLSQIKTWARFLPERPLCSAATPHGSSRSALSEASFVLCLARNEALKIISCISWNPLMPASWSLWHICCQLLVSVCWPAAQSSYIFNAAQCVPSLPASLSSGWAGLGEFGWSIVFPSKDWRLMEKMICGPPQGVPKWHVVRLILISKMLDNSQCLCSSSPIQTLWDCQFSKALFEQFTEELEGIRWSKNTVKFSKNPRKVIGLFLPY